MKSLDENYPPFLKIDSNLDMLNLIKIMYLNKLTISKMASCLPRSQELYKQLKVCNCSHIDNFQWFKRNKTKQNSSI